MARVLVSSTRFASLLTNRNRQPSDVAVAVHTDIDVSELAQRDLEVALDDLMVLAKFLGKPWPYLLIDEAEPAPAGGRDHRTHANRIAPLSTEMIEQLQASDDLLDAITDLFPDEVMLAAPFAIAETSPDESGLRIRGMLGITADMQLAARDGFGALRLWIDALDTAGVYVSQRRLSDPTVRAFSLFRAGHALAVIDTGDSGIARGFSLIHEYVHLLMRAEGLCDLDERSAVERRCNAIAAAALLPIELLAAVSVPVLAGEADNADAELQRASAALKVSQQSLLIRLRDTSYISRDQYADLEQRRASRRALQRESSGGNFYTTAINRVGRRFARQVFSVLGDGTISRQEAAAVLGVRENQVAQLREKL